MTFLKVLTFIAIPTIFLCKCIINQDQQYSHPRLNMSYHHAKESIYQIQPWAEQSNTFPHFFANTNGFNQTTISSKFQKKPHQKLEIAANTVYVIKNQQEQHHQRSKKRIRYHRTAHNSPRFAQQQEESFEGNELKQERYQNLTQLSTKINKSQVHNPEKKMAFPSTKNLVFEIKPMKKKQALNSGKLSLAVDEKKAIQTNLIKIYQKSTVANERKKKLKLQKKELDQICEKRKIKTENSKERSPLRMQLTSTLLFNDDIPSSQNREKIKTIKSEMGKTCYIPKHTNEKMSFQLLVQRKLYLLKNKVQTTQKRYQKQF